MSTMKSLQWCSLVALLSVCSIVSLAYAQGISTNELFNNQNNEVPTFSGDAGHQPQRGLKFLVQDPQTILEYHNGPILTQQNTPVYVIWYGAFTEDLKNTIRDFFASFNYSVAGTPTVSSWWNLTSGYKDGSGRAVSQHINLAAELDDSSYSLGKDLNDSDVELLVLKAINSTFPADSQSVYVVMTSANVNVGDFCMNSCAAHSATSPVTTPGGKQLPYAWVADSEIQCPGKCSWPFAKAEYGPDTPALVPPNADVGTDGMVINLAAILAGCLTNPFDNGFYQGDAAAPLEAATACAGMFGQDSYSGNPGVLQTDKISGASYNTEGVNSRRFLLPALWEASSRTCTPPS
ncbi:unnamed protein product [Calypogeia fissa]